MNAQVYPIFLPNKGPKLDSPSQFLLNQWASYSRNMEYENDVIRGRKGLQEFDSKVLSGPVLHIVQFWHENLSYDLLVFTTKDIYKYDFSNTRYTYLTPSTNTGTIEVQVGTPTILRGTGTTWDTAGANKLKTGDFVKIGAAAYHTGSTFYEVLTVDSNTQCTMTSAMPTTAAGSAYVARKIYTGDAYDLWNGAQFFDSAQGNMYLATNGVDTPVYLTETATEFVAFGTLPTGFTTCRYIRNFYNRVVLIACVEGGQNLFIRIRWGEVGLYNSYDDLDFNDLDLPDAAHIIVGADIVGDYMVFPKLGVNSVGGAYIMRVSASENDFDFQYESNFEGNAAALSLVSHNSGLLYFGEDNKFRFFNVVRDVEVFKELTPEFKSLDPNETPNIRAFRMGYKNQIRWALPYDSINGVARMVVYDFTNDHAEIWEYKLSGGIRSFGEFLNTTDLYVDDAVWGPLYVDENFGYWDDREFLSDAPIILYGGADGKVYKADNSDLDVTTPYTRKFRTKKHDFELPHCEKRLAKQQWWLEKQTTGTALLKCKRSDKEDFEPTTHTIDMTDTTKEIVKKQVRWNKQFDAAEFQIESTGLIGILGYLNWIHRRGQTVH